jgi:hypothetical protein
MLRNLKHQYPSQTIKSFLLPLYAHGHYLPYGQLQLLEYWITYKKPINQKFYDNVVLKGIYNSPQSARNEIVKLRRLGIVIKKNKLLIY